MYNQPSKVQLFFTMKCPKFPDVELLKDELSKNLKPKSGQALCYLAPACNIVQSAPPLLNLYLRHIEI